MHEPELWLNPDQEARETLGGGYVQHSVGLGERPLHSAILGNREQAGGDWRGLVGPGEGDWLTQLTPDLPMGEHSLGAA